jgi:hypothetical protein
LQFLSQEGNLVTSVHYYTQALIHSNLFDAYVNRHGKLTDLTLNEMAARNHKKPFICSIIDGMFIRCFIYVLPMFSLCFSYVFPMFFQCF